MALAVATSISLLEHFQCRHLLGLLVLAYSLSASCIIAGRGLTGCLGHGGVAVDVDGLWKLHVVVVVVVLFCFDDSGQSKL